MNFIPKIEYIEINTGLAKSITFDSPPEGDPFGEELSPSVQKTTSNNGTVQTQFNYLKQIYTLEFIFQLEATMQLVEDFYINHAVRGGKFNYFESSDEVEFKTFELDTRGFSKKRPIPSAVLGEFEYDFNLKMSRVINVL